MRRIRQETVINKNMENIELIEEINDWLVAAERQASLFYRELRNSEAPDGPGSITGEFANLFDVITATKDFFDFYDPDPENWGE